MHDVSRRNFVIGSAAALAASGMASTAFAKYPTNASSLAADGSYPSNVDDDPYFTKPDPITDIAATYDYEVVVIGGGATGCPAALAAADFGAKTALLQKAPHIYSNGRLWSGWNVERVVEAKGGARLSDEDFDALKDEFMQQCHYACQAGLLNKFFKETTEAIEWLCNLFDEHDIDITINATAEDSDPYSYIFRVPLEAQGAYQVLCDSFADKGLDVYYSCPALQLVQDEDGRVCGVIGQDRDGDYIQFNASKGVIIGTGGYGGNAELVKRWLPQCTTVQNGVYPEYNTGDGALMAIWAGAAPATIKSKKIDIRFYGYHAARSDIEKLAFLLVNDQGRRMGNESITEMWQNNFVLQDPSESGTYYCIFDGNYPDWLDSIGSSGAVLSDEEIEEYESFAAPLLWEAQTLEELAEKIDVPFEQLKATVERYNELAEIGHDDDYGKPAQYLYKISEPPFYAMVRSYTFGGTLGAVKVSDDCQAINRHTGEPIEGLYVCGNDMGGLQTAQDYVWYPYGMTLTSNATLAYAVARDLALAD